MENWLAPLVVPSAELSRSIWTVHIETGRRAGDTPLSGVGSADMFGSPMATGNLFSLDR